MVTRQKNQMFYVLFYVQQVKNFRKKFLNTLA